MTENDYRHGLLKDRRTDVVTFPSRREERQKSNSSRFLVYISELSSNRLCCPYYPSSARMDGNRLCPSINLTPSSGVNIDPGSSRSTSTPVGAAGGINLPQSAIVDLGIGPRVMETLVGARGEKFN